MNTVVNTVLLLNEEEKRWYRIEKLMRRATTTHTNKPTIKTWKFNISVKLFQILGACLFWRQLLLRFTFNVIVYFSFFFSLYFSVSVCRATRFMASRHIHSIWCHYKYLIQRDLVRPQRCSWWQTKAVSILRTYISYTTYKFPSKFVLSDNSINKAKHSAHYSNLCDNLREWNSVLFTCEFARKHFIGHELLHLEVEQLLTVKT